MARVRWIRLPGFEECFVLRADTRVGTFVLSRDHRQTRPTQADQVRVVLYPRLASSHLLTFGAPVIGTFDSVTAAQEHVDRLVACAEP